MKSIVLRALGVAAVAACLSGSVYAQSSDAAATEAPAAATSAPKAAAKTAKKANRKLGYAVRKAITKAGGIDVANIVVRSKGGAITLEGTVPTQIDKAEEAAKGVSGVTSVSNKLTFSSSNAGRRRVSAACAVFRRPGMPGPFALERPQAARSGGGPITISRGRR